MELSIGIFNNRNSWIQQIFRLAQQFMIKRGRRGSREREWGNYSENQYFILKVWKCIKLSLKKTSAKICDLVIRPTPTPFIELLKFATFIISSVMIVKFGLCENTEIIGGWFCFMRWLLAWPHNPKGNSECFVAFFPPVLRRIGIKLMHLFICGRSARAADRGLILFEAQQMQPYRER